MGCPNILAGQKPIEELGRIACHADRLDLRRTYIGAGLETSAAERAVLKPDARNGQPKTCPCTLDIFQNGHRFVLQFSGVRGDPAIQLYERFLIFDGASGCDQHSGIARASSRILADGQDRLVPHDPQCRSDTPEARRG
jgi:hypothetical protein